MKKEQFHRLNTLLEDFLLEDEKLVFSSKSVHIIISHFSKQLLEQNWNANRPDIDMLLNQWQDHLIDFRRELIKSATSADSVYQINSRRTIAIREDDALKATLKCPPPPRPLIR